MKTRLRKKSQAQSAATVTPAPAQLQSRPLVEASDSSPIAANQAALPNLQRQQNQAGGLWNFGQLQVQSSTPTVIQPKLSIGRPNDKYEQEADQVAQQVVQQINAPAQTASAQGQTIQREAMPEEEEVQTKPLAESIQRQDMPEEEEVQTKPLAESIQRQDMPEEEEVQTKPLAESIQRQDMPEEEEVQTKPLAESLQRQDMTEEEEVQTKPLAESIQRQDMPEEEEVQTKPLAESIQRQDTPEEEEVQTKPLAESIQRQDTPEEEEVQTKPLAESIQRQDTPEEEEVQTKPTGELQSVRGGMQAPPDVESSIEQARGSGQPLDASIKQPMEKAFGADFSEVKIHANAQSDQLNRSINAQAFTTKNDIFFKQGSYNPKSEQGQELLAHELTHVVQQKGHNTIQKKTQDLHFEERMVTQKWLFSFALSTKTEDINKLVKEFNKLKSDQNLAKQSNILQNIIKLTTNWLKDYKAGKKRETSSVTNDARAKHIEQLQRQAVEQKLAVDIQLENHASGKRVDVVGSGMNALTLGMGGDEVKQGFTGNLDQKALQNLGTWNGINGPIKEVSAVVKSGKFEPANVGLLTWLKNKLLVLGGPVIGIAMAIDKVVARWGWLSELQNQKSAKTGSQEYKDALSHAVGKVERSAISAMFKLFDKIINFITLIITLVTGGAAAVAQVTIQLITTIMNFLKTAYHTLKGIYKAIFKTRGKGRKKSAKAILNEALAGSNNAGKLIGTLMNQGYVAKITDKAMGFAAKAGSLTKWATGDRRRYEMYEKINNAYDQDNSGKEVVKVLKEHSQREDWIGSDGLREGLEGKLVDALSSK